MSSTIESHVTRISTTKPLHAVCVSRWSVNVLAFVYLPDSIWCAVIGIDGESLKITHTGHKRQGEQTPHEPKQNVIRETNQTHEFVQGANCKLGDTDSRINNVFYCEFQVFALIAPVQNK